VLVQELEDADVLLRVEGHQLAALGWLPKVVLAVALIVWSATAWGLARRAVTSVGLRRRAQH
jgi:hypothetical protein